MKTKAKNKKAKITAVTLAKDVLKWLAPGGKVKIQLRKNFAYVRPTGSGVSYIDRHGAEAASRYYLKPSSMSMELQDYLKAGKTCNVCAIGAFVAAKAYREDHFPIDYHGAERADAAAFLESEFAMSSAFDIRSGREPMRTIELAYETGEGVSSKIRSAKGRMRFICHNIIKNKGKFIPQE